MVGAVIVKQGRIIGQGWHARRGGLHAERHALQSCTEDPAGATLYVTLEPCCHQGRQPPCTDAVLQAGIARVVVGSDDPNPLVAGRGIRVLREHGVQVDTGVLREECDRLNPAFFHYIRTGRPYVVMKYAMTLDGKIATRTGVSRWVTGEEARRHVHETRHCCRAILAGCGDGAGGRPLLTCRLEGGRNPLRVICDSRLRTPLDSRIVRTAGQVDTILATCEEDPGRTAPYLAAGCQVWSLPGKDGPGGSGRPHGPAGQGGGGQPPAGGGGTLNWAMLEAGLVHRVQAYLAPKLFGGGDARSPVEGLGVAEPAQGAALRHVTVTPLGRTSCWKERWSTVFTGMVEELGTIRAIRRGASSAVLSIGAGTILDDLKVGDSVAVNGVCLTATQVDGGGFTADVMHETLDRSSLARLAPGDKVNLERAMAAGGRFGGHIVSGHIDATGTITDRRRDDNAVWYTVSAPAALLRYVWRRAPSP